MFRGRVLGLFVGSLLAIWFSVDAASARSWLAHTSNPNGQIFSTDDGPTLIALRPDLATTFDVKTSGPARLLIYLNAECAVASAIASASVSLEIRVDGATIFPTGPGHAFCSADGDGQLDGRLTAASDVAIDVAAGDHQVSVLGQMSGSSGSWTIDDLSLIVVVGE